MATRRKQHRLKVPKFRVVVQTPYRKGSIGVFYTKAEAVEFQRRTRKRYREPDMRKLMKDTTVYVAPLTPEERAGYGKGVRD